MTAITVVHFILFFYVTSGFIVQDPVRNASVHELYTQLKREIADLNNEFVNLENKYANVKSESVNVRASIDTITNSYDNIENEIATIDTENAEGKSALLNITKQLISIETEYMKTKQSSLQIEQKFNSLGHQQSELESKISDVYKEYNRTTYSNGSTTTANITVGDKRSVGFSVSEPTQSTIGRDGPLLFNKSIYNGDGAFNFTSGRFECSIPGLYFFSSTIIRETGGYPESFCYLMMNGHARAYLGAYSFNASYGHPSGTASILYQMDKGDTAYVGMCGVLMQISTSSSFTGFLIYED